jgi:hypothetical protein
VDQALLERVHEPECKVKGATRPVPGTGETGDSADPNLIEIARLQLERDCYRNAEISVRGKLKRLQDAMTPGS